MTEWSPDLSAFAGPKYRALADALAQAVEKGDLRPGDRLPPQRALARDLGIDITTITRAFEIAQRRGHIITRGRAGSFIRTGAGAATGARNTATALPGGLQVDTAMNTPPIPAGDVLQTALARTMQAVLASGDPAILHYQRPGGSPDARHAGTQLMARAGLNATADSVVVTAGSQNALNAILGTIARPGDRIACAPFVYTGFRAVAQRMGLVLVPLPEMTGAALAAACAQGPIRALYAVPTNDNPTTATIPAQERVRIATVMRAEGVQLIEDDAYGLLDPHPIAPITSHAPELSWYVLSTSKIISPALRVGFVKAPDMAQALQLGAQVHETAVMAPPLNAAVVAAWLEDGSFDRLLAATRAETTWRVKLARAVLGDAQFACHPYGHHLWLTLPPGVEAAALAHRLASAGIGTVPSTRFAVVPVAEQALRVSLGGVAEHAALEAALRALASHVTAALRQWETVV